MTVEEALATLEAVLGKGSLNDLQELIVRQAWEQKTYPEIAASSGYDDGYVKYVGFQLWKTLSDALGEKVSKNNFRGALRRWQAQGKNGEGTRVFNADTQNLLAVPPCRADTATEGNIVSSCRQDWGEAIDVSVFYGRGWELATLDRWIVRERCRLVALLGLGGIGKTALSVKLAEQIQDNFESAIWRSLHNAPSLESLLAGLIEFLSDRQETDLPDNVSDRISRLLDYLRSSRCLIILDNAETILSQREYGELFQRIGESAHQSCLVLTSREKPKAVAVLEGETLPVRSLQLSGLLTAEGRELCRGKGSFSGSEIDYL
jgi:hypothetical protein